MLAHLSSFFAKLHLSGPALAAACGAIYFAAQGDWTQALTLAGGVLASFGIHVEIQQTAK